MPAILTDDDIALIRRLSNGGHTIRSIERVTGFHRDTISVKLRDYSRETKPIVWNHFDHELDRVDASSGSLSDFLDFSSENKTQYNSYLQDVAYHQNLQFCLVPSDTEIKLCKVCKKQRLFVHGYKWEYDSVFWRKWSPVESIEKACSDECLRIHEFYWNDNGTQLSSCNGFRTWFGCTVNQVPVEQSFDALLSYMVGLSAKRAKKYAKFGNT